MTRFLVELIRRVGSRDQISSCRLLICGNVLFEIEDIFASSDANVMR